MAVCCCSLAGTAACQHCANNPFATNVWTNKTVTVDRVDVKPIGNGLGVCLVCEKPSSILKPQTNSDRIRAMNDEELAQWIAKFYGCSHCPGFNVPCDNKCKEYWIEWLKQEIEE